MTNEAQHQKRSFALPGTKTAGNSKLQPAVVFQTWNSTLQIKEMQIAGHINFLLGFNFKNLLKH